MASSPIRFVLPLGLAALAMLPSTAFAGTITAQGNVTALTNVNELQGIVGTGTYNEANAGQVPLAVYTPQGMTFKTGALVNILAGVMTPGNATQPQYQSNGNYFPAPIAGGGIATGSFNFHAGVVTFDQPITQFGLTAATNGTQYITVWDQNGLMIGQVTWQPAGDSAFVGIDTNGQPIGMLAYGNDNLWGGGTYDVSGSTVISDQWIWAAGEPCITDADCMDDMNPCTLKQCSNGACLYPADPNGVCTDDGNLCTDDLCQAGQCVHPDNSDPCDDLDACTDVDTCSQGECEGEDIECADMNLCSIDSCDSEIGCVFDFQPGCCTTDEECPRGEICLIGSNSCIEDPGETGTDTDTSGDDTTGDGDGTEGTTDDGETTGDGDGDTEESTTDGGSGSDGEEDVGESGTDDVGDGGLDTFGGDTDADGCSCSTEEQNAGGALLGLLGLGLLGMTRRRRANVN